MSSQPATALTGCLAPIDKTGLDSLIEKGKADPKAVKTLKCKTVAEGRFRHANYIRDLAPYIVDEPPGLLGDDTAPNPSEASLAALGSCVPMRSIAASPSTRSRSNSKVISTSPPSGARATFPRSLSASPMCASSSTWMPTRRRRPSTS